MLDVVGAVETNGLWQGLITSLNVGVKEMPWVGLLAAMRHSPFPRNDVNIELASVGILEDLDPDLSAGLVTNFDWRNWGNVGQDCFILWHGCILGVTLEDKIRGIG